MSDVLLIFVAEDLDRAEALAAACEEAGLSLHDGAAEPGAYRTALALWSDAAAACPQFHAAAHDPLVDGKALIANFTGAPTPDFMSGATAFDLSDWNGEENVSILAPLLTALQRRARYASILADLKTFAAGQDAEPAPEVLVLDTPVAAAPEPEPAHRTPAEIEPAQTVEEPVLYAPLEASPAAAIELPKPLEAEFEPVEPVAEITPIPPTPRPKSRPEPRRRTAKPARARRVRPAPVKKRADHKLHHLSQALVVSAGVFALVMIGGAFSGALAPARHAPAAEQVAEATALPLIAPAAAETAPAEAAPAAIEPERPAQRRARRSAPVLPPKLARAIAAQQLERAQWALAQEKLVKDEPQRSAEVRLPASSRALASGRLSR